MAIDNSNADALAAAAAEAAAEAEAVAAAGLRDSKTPIADVTSSSNDILELSNTTRSGGFSAFSGDFSDDAALAAMTDADRKSPAAAAAADSTKNSGISRTPPFTGLQERRVSATSVAGGQFGATNITVDELGLDLEVRSNGVVTVRSVAADSLAAAAGIQAEDAIIAVCCVMLRVCAGFHSL